MKCQWRDKGVNNRGAQAMPKSRGMYDDDDWRWSSKKPHKTHSCSSVGLAQATTYWAILELFAVSFIHFIQPRKTNPSTQINSSLVRCCSRTRLFDAPHSAPTTTVSSSLWHINHVLLQQARWKQQPLWHAGLQPAHRDTNLDLDRSRSTATQHCSAGSWHRPLW